MLLSRLLADFTRGEADTLRKAMGKKIKSKLDELRPKFIKGGINNGHDEKILTKIWADWEKFASYAFNKSHATCYSWVAYQTAYLKANFPSEYMASLLSSNLNDITTLTEYMSECKRMGINVLSPDVNESMLRFSSNKSGDVRFGLAGIKGVGEAAALSIINERERNGRYKDIYDFFERINFSVVNRKCLENIAYAGGFDSLCDFSRSKFFSVDSRDTSGTQFIEYLIRYGQRFIAEKSNAQQSLFGGDSGASDLQRPVVPVCEEWNRLMGLNKEREVIGMYMTSHPLDEYKPLIDKLCNAQLSDLEHLADLDGKEIVVAGVVTSAEQRTTKDGKQVFGIFTVEDYGGRYEFRLYRKDYERFRPLLYEGYYLLIRGNVVTTTFYKKEDVARENPTVRIEYRISTITQLQEVADGIKEINISVPIEKLDNQFVSELAEAVKNSRGKASLRMTLIDSTDGVTLRLHSKKRKVSLSEQLVQFMEKYNLDFGMGQTS